MDRIGGQGGGLIAASAVDHMKTTSFETEVNYGK
jgi:hypothetical protein